MQLTHSVCRTVQAKTRSARALPFFFFFFYFKILTEFQNFVRISQFWQNFIISTEFHNFNRISQFWQKLTITTEFHNFDRISQYWVDFIILTKLLKIDKISQFSVALAALYLPCWFINSFINYTEFIPTLVVFALPSTMPHTMMSVQCRTQCSQIIISKKFTILTEFHNFDRISHFWQNFRILSKFHNFDKISQFWQNFTIFDRISQFWQNFTIFTEFHNFEWISFWVDFKISQNWQKLSVFSCPSTFIPFWLIHCCEFRALQTKCTWPTYLTYLHDLPSWPTYLPSLKRHFLHFRH